MQELKTHAWESFNRQNLSSLAGFKIILKRATYRKMPYLILCEAAATALIYFSNQRSLLVTRWWYFALGFVMLVLLAALEHRPELPLPFADHLTSTELVSLPLLGFAVMFLGDIVTALVFEHLQGLSLASVSNYGLGLSLHAGISEESFKVGLTNIPVIVLRKRFFKTRSRKMDSAIIILVGTGAVAVWAWMHVQFANFSPESTFAAFLGGMGLFLILLASKNYLPLVAGHTLYDLFITLLLHQ